MSSLRRAVKESQQQNSRGKVVDIFDATIGGFLDGTSVLFSDDPNEIYVSRTGRANAEKVKNAIAPPVPGLEVICGRAWGNSYFQVIDFNFNSLKNLQQRATPTVHGPTHSMGVILGQAPAGNQLGPDPVFISDRQLSTLGIIPKGMLVQIQKGVYKINGVRYWWDGGESVDFTSEIPGSGLAKWALIELDTALTQHVRYSATFNAGDATQYMIAAIPKPRARRKEIITVLLINGMSSIGWQHLQPIARVPDTVGIHEASLQTTDATETEIAAVDIAENEAVTVRGMATGHKSDFSAAVGGDFVAVLRRATGGNVTMVGSPQYRSQEDSSGTPEFKVVADTSDQTASLRVVGIAAETWDWTVVYDYIIK